MYKMLEVILKDPVFWGSNSVASTEPHFDREGATLVTFERILRTYLLKQWMEISIY